MNYQESNILMTGTTQATNNTSALCTFTAKIWIEIMNGTISTVCSTNKKLILYLPSLSANMQALGGDGR